jgi:hypothetical protein
MRPAVFTLLFLAGLAIGCRGDLSAPQRVAARGAAPAGLDRSPLDAPSTAPVSTESAATVASAAPAADPAPPETAAVERIEVPGDEMASFVRASDGAPPRVVFLAGICTIGYAYLYDFPEAARAHGGVITLEGDQPCPSDKAYRSFSSDADKQEQRIEAAITAMTGAYAVPEGGFTLVGYSRGATIAERMAKKWPERYPRIVLIGSPSEPALDLLNSARAVVTMSCSKDVPWRMKGALPGLKRRGIPAEYFEMPDCTHGLIADGERVFGEAFDWLAENQKRD